MFAKEGGRRDVGETYKRAAAKPRRRTATIGVIRSEAKDLSPTSRGIGCRARHLHPEILRFAQDDVTIVRGSPAHVHLPWPR